MKNLKLGCSPKLLGGVPILGGQKIQIHPNIASGGVQERQNQNIPWIKLNHTVSHYANGPGWPL